MLPSRHVPKDLTRFRSELDERVHCSRPTSRCFFLHREGDIAWRRSWTCYPLPWDQVYWMPSRAVILLKSGAFLSASQSVLYVWRQQARSCQRTLARNMHVEKQVSNTLNANVLFQAIHHHNKLFTMPRQRPSYCRPIACSRGLRQGQDFDPYDDIPAHLMIGFHINTSCWSAGRNCSG